MHGGIEEIKPYVDEFIAFARVHPELKFLVTRIGCGIAGFTDEEMAPLFAEASSVENIFLLKVLEGTFRIKPNPYLSNTSGDVYHHVGSSRSRLTGAWAIACST